MTRIILIGAGRGGRALVELFHKDPSIEIVGVADKDEGAPGIVLARELGLPVAANYRKFLKADAADLIIDVTGDPDVGREIYRLRPHGTEVVGGKTARFICGVCREQESSGVSSESISTSPARTRSARGR